MKADGSLCLQYKPKHAEGAGVNLLNNSVQLTPQGHVVSACFSQVKACTRHGFCPVKQVSDPSRQWLVSPPTVVPLLHK